LVGKESGRGPQKQNKEITKYDPISSICRPQEKEWGEAIIFAKNIYFQLQGTPESGPLLSLPPPQGAVPAPPAGNLSRTLLY
jgi:hypothetical protein